MIPSPQRVAINRANALKSTGPRSSAGKARASKNAVRSGVYSLCPVIAGVEKEEDWQAFRRAMMESLKPVAEIENVLVERITLIAWRLRRVIRAETATLQAEAEQLREPVRKLEDSRGWKVSIGELLTKLSAADDDAEFSEDEAELVLWRALGTATDESSDFELEVAFEPYWEALGTPQRWTAGGIRRLVADLADQHEWTMGDLMVRMQADATSDCDSYRAEMDTKHAKLCQDQSACLIPREETLAKIGRYESHLSREMFRCLHELQRVQAERLRPMASVFLDESVDVR